MIAFEGVGVTYDGAARPTLRDVDLHVPEGELALVVGRTGSGKTTLLRCVNGLVPWFSGGRLDGRVRVAGVDTRDARPRDLAHLVGVVGQDPLAGFVTDTVEEELAYGMEQLAVAPTVMRARVEETLDLLGIADLRTRPLRTLSGGQQQRVAIGAAMTMQPRVLVLDEPTSALDPTAAEEVLAAITRLVHDLGITAVLAEHRLERVVQLADRVVHVGTDGRVRDAPPAQAMESSDVAPPVVHLGRALRWSPLPLSVRDARRAAQRDPAVPRLRATTPTPRASGPDGATRLVARGLHVRHGDVHAVRGVELTLRAGEVVALMGRNGSGKSSLLWALHGVGRHAAPWTRPGLFRRGRRDRSGGEHRDHGTVALHAAGGGVDPPDGVDPADLPPEQVRRLVGLVPQTASDLLYLETTALECAATDRDAEVPEGTCAAVLERLAPGVDPARHPRDLSEGQRLALVLAIQLTSAPGVLLLDEPTRGLDYDGKAELTRMLAQLARDPAGTGPAHAVLVATHDVEFVAGLADRVLLLAEGELVAQGRTHEVIGASPAFAPQTAKVLGSAWLTVAQVREAPAEEVDA